MKQTFLISGAAGFIGSQLCNTLLKKGHTVIGLVRGEASDVSRLHLSENLRLIVCPNNRLEKLPETLNYSGTIDCFIHTAWEGNSGPRRSDYTLQLQNVMHAMTAYAICPKLNIKHFIGLGTITELVAETIESMPKAASQNLLYGWSKLCAYKGIEILSRSQKTPFIWARLTNVFGAGNETGNIVDYTLKTLLNGKCAEFSTGKQPYDLIHIDDVSRALLLLAEKPCFSGVITVGSGNPRPLAEYLTEIGRLLNRENQICLGARPDDGVEYRPEWFSISCLKQAYGFSATIPFNEGIMCTVEALLKKEKKQV